MFDLFLWSDTHFNHDRILTFTLDGKLIRPGYVDVDHMNSHMIERHNAIVPKKATVLHCGDVAFKAKQKEKELDEILGSLHGEKILIPGNHDQLRQDSILWKHFKKIETTWAVFEKLGFTASHIPQRLDQLRETKYNVHGHIHNELMDDPHYINVCVEHTGGGPVHVSEILATIKQRES